MLHLARNAISLFLEGKLFRDLRYFYMRLAIGVAATVAVMLLASLVIKSVIVVALIGGLIGGALQPYLFEDVRYQ
jgi:hypothetical protein